MSNLRLPQGFGAGGDAGGHNELEEVPNIYQLLKSSSAGAMEDICGYQYFI